MDNLRQLTNRLKTAGNPAWEIGNFLLQHSNDPGYLIVNLGNFLKAVEADRQADIDLANSLSQ